MSTVDVTVPPGVTAEMGFADYVPLLKDIAPLYLGFYALYYVSGFLSGILFDSYDKLDAATRAYWRSSVVSSVHAVLVVKLALDGASALEMWTTDDFFGSSPESSRANRVFLSYLAYDLTNVLYWRKRWSGWKATAIHHAMGLACWTTIETRGVAHVLGITAILTEITTPFVNTRWFLAETGLKKSVLYMVNGLVMTLLWFVFRILLFIWLGFRLYAMRFALFAIPPDQSNVIELSFVIGFTLQVFWFRKIAKGAYKTLAGGGGGGKKKAA